VFRRDAEPFRDNPDCPAPVKGQELSRAPASFLCEPKSQRIFFMLGTILIIVLVLLLLGALPSWPYSTGWGYYPSGGLGLILIIIVVLVLLGRF
jgi:hypothetical protein